MKAAMGLQPFQYIDCFTRDKMKTILLIEDEKTNIRLIKRMVQLMLPPETELVIATSASEGVEKAREYRDQIQVVLTDVKLPDSDLNSLGGNIVTPIRGILGDVHIIALTAHALKGIDEQVRTAGCDECYTKPLDVEIFSRHLASLLEADFQHSN